jgi:hypothetical protein
MLSNRSRYHDRHEAIDTAEWVSAFTQHVRNGNAPVRQTLIKLFGTYAPATSEPTPEQDSGMRCECLHVIAQAVVESHPDLATQFLANAIEISRRPPGFATRLLDDVVRVVALNPVQFLSYFVEFLLLIPQKGNERLLGKIHGLLDSWTDAQRDSHCESLMRKGQELVVPYLLGYDERPRRYSPGDARIAAAVNVVTPEEGTAVTMLGEVRDISGGFGTDIGRGIHIQVPDWSFECLGNVIEPAPGSPCSRRIRAVKHCDNNTLVFSDPGIVLTYPGGGEVRCDRTTTIRGFARYKKRYGLQGGGLVVLLGSETSSLDQWRTFVRTLLPVDYANQIGSS